MAEELPQTPPGVGQEVASPEQPPVTPDAAEVQPKPPEMVPVEDLRKVQGVKDREVAAATARAQTAEQRLAALETSMEQLATQTMGADEAQQFIGQRRQQSQLADLQRQATEGQKYRDIIRMSNDSNIPISEFEAVLGNPNATYLDAQKVVTSYYQKQIEDFRRQKGVIQEEAKTVARKVERQERSEDGSDAIGAPAEPTVGSPDLEAQYQKEKAAIIAGAAAGRRGMDTALLRLRSKYRDLGLDSLKPS